MGCDWIVPRHGASSFASIDGSISLVGDAPMSFSTSGSFGWTGVFVIMCQNVVRASTLAGSCAHGVAAMYCCPPMVIAIGAIIGSGGCAIFGSSYVPGTFAFHGSPEPEVWKMMNCALLGEMQLVDGSASALRGFMRSPAGSPVARARRPT